MNEVDSKPIGGAVGTEFNGFFASKKAIKLRPQLAHLSGSKRNIFDFREEICINNFKIR